MCAYKRVGFTLSHGATDQARRGARVSLRHLKLGDRVFYGGSGYYGHVGIYVGRGRVIHAPHTGAVVSYAKLQGAATARRLISSSSSPLSRIQRFGGARRWVRITRGASRDEGSDEQCCAVSRPSSATRNWRRSAFWRRSSG